MKRLGLTDDELDELSDFLFWIEDRTLEGPGWRPGQNGPIRFSEGVLADAVERVHAEWRRMKGIDGGGR